MASAPATVWTLSITQCDREGGAPCEARSSSVFSTKKRAVAALEPILLAHILGMTTSLGELADACPDYFEEKEDTDECNWKLRAGVDIQQLYIDSGTQEMDEDCQETTRWSYDLSETTIDEPSIGNELPDEFETLAAELLQPGNRAGEKRKKSSDSKPKKCAKHDD